jgi:hypothetical protein
MNMYGMLLLVLHIELCFQLIFVFICVLRHNIVTIITHTEKNNRCRYLVITNIFL